MAAALGNSRPLADILEADLSAWYSGLSGQNVRYREHPSRPVIQGGLSVCTLRGHLRAVKRFFTWLYKKGILSADLGAGLVLPRLPHFGRKGISEGDLRAILEAARPNVRDYALLRFLEASGCRRGGLAELRLSDLNLDSAEPRLQRRVTIREKGERERTVVLTPNALAALKAWLVIRVDLPDDHVFLGRSPGQDWRPLSAGGISSLLRRYKEFLGLRGACSPHQWRHRFCRKRLQEGMDLSRVSQLAGHLDPAITIRYYGQFSLDALQDGYDELVEDIE
jgi:integrase/recombinase XerD